ncbi:hypothetical protein SteCoe_19969 [Stentor coeruleus]|uniref:RING-type domain-containing protein n=1 Tax=Stentor coeruleus TaxID=5963 RepID=A0A1R2BTH7_9CILI|nr:hypothetical protein SteCoe_19969 [Stentor coeruleus]
MEKTNLFCSLCNTPYSQNRKPCTFPCNHTFCLTCLSSQKVGYSVKCPTDNTSYSFTHLKADLNLLKILEDSIESSKIPQKIFDINHGKSYSVENLISGGIEKSKTDEPQKINFFSSEIQTEAISQTKSVISKSHIPVFPIQENIRKNSQVPINFPPPPLIVPNKSIQVNVFKELNEPQLSYECTHEEILKVIQDQKLFFMNKYETEKAKLEDEYAEMLSKAVREKEDMLRKDGELKMNLRSLNYEMQAQRIQEEKEKEIRIFRESLKEKFMIEEEKLKEQLKNELTANLMKLEEEKLIEINKIREDERFESERKISLAKAEMKVKEKIRCGKLKVEGANNKEIWQRDKNRVYWAFSRDEKYYSEYFPKFSNRIESAFFSGQKSVELYCKGTVNFLEWCETSVTGEKLKIKRVNALEGPGRWSFFKDSHWVDFFEEDQFTIENAWLSKGINCVISSGIYCDLISLQAKIGGKNRPMLRLTTI